MECINSLLVNALTKPCPCCTMQGIACPILIKRPLFNVILRKGAGPLNNQTPNPWRAFAKFGVIGIELAVCIVAGLFAGRWLDNIMGTEPVFLIIGILCGVLIGIISMIFLIKQYLGDS